MFIVFFLLQSLEYLELYVRINGTPVSTNPKNFTWAVINFLSSNKSKVAIRLLLKAPIDFYSMSLLLTVSQVRL